MYNTPGMYFGVWVGANMQMLWYIYILFTAPWQQLARKASAHDKTSNDANLNVELIENI